jgi:hypothetical protein
MFHIDSDGDESTGKEPCHQAFLVGGKRGSDGHEKRMYFASSEKTMAGICMYAQFSTRNGHGV